ncbi:alpha/beta hydrolase family protein [Paenibacillus taichungensis]|uniref:alpha/beta hydrolase family protein n=1 Tax=Paenibacillus taichungensis TaxID=484184 RepID=UPI0035E0AD10
MRNLEAIVILWNIAVMGWILVGQEKRERGLIISLGISVIVTLLQGILEGMRWQLFPAYALAVVPLYMLVRARLPWSTLLRSSKSSVMKRSIGMIAAVIYAFVAVALPLLLPVFTFSEPTGVYKVGTTSYEWTDATREETFTPSDGDKRKLKIQIWYPANKDSKADISPYVQDGALLAEGYHRLLDMPKQLFNSIGYVKTHSLENVDISDEEAAYPVLIFSHGLNGHKNQNTFQIEEIASHGYIVVGIDHTYNSTVSQFSDGTVAYFTPGQDETVEMMDQTNEIWLADAKFVLDQVEKLAAHDPDHRFTGRMNLERIGMFGHSFGGATSTQMLMSDPRIKAALNMDGVLYGKLRVPEGGLNKPFLMMSADQSRYFEQYIQDPALTASLTDLFKRYDHITDGGNYWLTLRNMSHMGFSDLYLTSPLFEWMGGISLKDSYPMINAYTLDFFNHFLKQEPLKLLDQNIGEHTLFTLEKGEK